MVNNKKYKGMNQLKKEQVLFAISFLVLPLLQFAIFYVYVNYSSILMSFQKFDVLTAEYKFYGFENFLQIFSDIKSGDLSVAIENSLSLYIWGFVFGMTLALAFSYYIYKKHIGSKFFRVMLYLPHVLSNVSVVTIYKYFVDACVPIMVEKVFGYHIDGLLVDLYTQYYTILFLSIYLSFGTRVLIYTSNMSGISESVVESAELDGITPIKEFFYITLPLIYPSVVDFILIGIAGIFTNQMLLYDMYSANAEKSLQTIGYFIFKKTQEGDFSMYPYISALGLIITVILTVVTLVVKKLLNKFGPSVD